MSQINFSQQDKAFFEKGLRALGCELSQAQQSQCLLYLQELSLWGKAFNMTTIQKPQEMIVRHLLDSLSVLPYLFGERIIDVGTGAGLPGIPLSIAKDNATFFLLDSNQKKQVFLSHVIKLLQLNHVQCVTSAVQAYQVAPKFSTIITRAFAPVEKMIALTAHLLSDDGQFVAMMGKRPTEPILLPQGFQFKALIPLKVPFESGERHVAIIQKKPA